MLKVCSLLAALMALASADTSSNIRGTTPTTEENDARDLLGGRSSVLPKDFQTRQTPITTPSCNTCMDEMIGGRLTTFRDDIFNQLSVMEYESVVNFVINQGLADSTIGGVSNWDKSLNSNYFVFAQLYDPPKQQALAYLDGLTDEPPQRFAIATVHRGAASPRDVMQYKVGPLVDGNIASDSAVEKMLQDNEIPWSMRGQYGRAERHLWERIINQANRVQDIFKATTGGYCIGDSSCDYSRNVMYHTSGNLKSDGTQRITNVNFYLRPSRETFGTAFLMPIPISFQLVENPDVNPNEWETTHWEYCYQGPFNSPAALLSKWEAGELKTCTMPNSGFEWTTTDPVQPLRENSLIKEPISFHSSGKRYDIDSNTGRRNLEEAPQNEKSDESNTQSDGEPTTDAEDWHFHTHLKELFQESMRQAKAEGRNNENKNRNLQQYSDGTGHKVSWMGWTFHVANDPMHGMVIRNLKFQGERLAYEMSFQEYFASYSSSGSASGIFYFDSNWQIGALSPLVLGVDCPEDATLLPISQYSGGDSWVSSDLLCIFEQPYGEPLWRHGFSRSNIGGIPRTALQVRIVSTMGNYDYIPTMSLMADGVMEMKLEMGGYLQGGYETDLDMPKADTPSFGTQVRDNVAGLLHDHVIGVKADFDVGGLANTLMAGKVTYGTYEQATGRASVEGLSQGDKNLGAKFMNWTTIDEETGISAKDYNSIVISSPSTNSWGVRRGYEIVFENTIPSQVYPPDHPIGRTTAWQYNNIAITKQKDSERRCSYPSNFNVGTPIPSYDLRTFQQGNDSVIDEDLVFWLMFGVEHYPKAEDVPLVSNFGSGFIMKPRNMYDRAAFEDLADNRYQNHPVCVASSVIG